MRVASISIVAAVLFLAGIAGQAKSGEVKPGKAATRAYAVVCRLVSETPAEMTQPGTTITMPRIVVTNGAAATIADTSDTAFAFGEGDLIQGKRAAVERKVTEGTKIELTVIAQDENHAVLDLAVELSSAEAPQGEAAPVRVTFAKGRWIERVELGKTVKFAARDGHVEATVTAVSEKDFDGGPLPKKVGGAADHQPGTIGYVKFTGNHIGRRHLDKQTGLQPGQALDVAQVRAGRERLLAYYREKGFPRIAVSIREGTGKDDLGVVYQINEGQKSKNAM